VSNEVCNVYINAFAVQAFVLMVLASFFWLS